MPTRNIMDRLGQGEVLVMDGGTGSELQRRGVNVLIGSRADHLAAWSATANVDAPDVVQQVHQDFLRVGADIIISNNFWTGKTKLADSGVGDRWEEYTRAAARIAVQARDAMNPEAYVAGGIAPPDRNVYEDFVEQSRVLAEEGVDLMLPEYVGSIADCVAAVDACATVDLPIFLGVRHITLEGTMQYGDSFADLASALSGHQVDAILLMCSRPEDISTALPLLRDVFEGPVGAYSEIGYFPLAPIGGEYTGDPTWDEVRNGGNGTITESIRTGQYTPSRMSDFAQEWIELGAQIVGGCCATGPEHIMAMASSVKKA